MTLTTGDMAAIRTAHLLPGDWDTLRALRDGAVSLLPDEASGLAVRLLNAWDLAEGLARAKIRPDWAPPVARSRPRDPGLSTSVQRVDILIARGMNRAAACKTVIEMQTGLSGGPRFSPAGWRVAQRFLRPSQSVRKLPH